MKIKLIILIIPLLLFIAACKESAPLADESRDFLDTYGEFKSDTLFAEEDTFLVKGKVNTGRSPKIPLGSYADFESRILIQFNLMPPDTMIYDSLKLIISSAYDLGESMGFLQGNVYRVTEEWDESVNSDENWDFRTKIDYSAETSASFSLPPMDSALYTDYKIDLPVSLVNFWQDTVGGNNNHGILLDFSSVGLIREFSSREGGFSTRRPKLVYVYHQAGTDSTIRDTVFTSQDAALIDYVGNFDNNKLYVSSGYAARSFFKFNFDSIPKTANLTSVSFFYDRDSLNSVINLNRNQHIYLRDVTTEFDELPNYEIDSTFVFSSFRNIVLYDRNNALQLDDRFRAGAAQYFIQDFINEFIVHGSFYLQYTNEGDDVSVYAIKGIDYPEKSLRPHLIVEYYVNPRGRL